MISRSFVLFAFVLSTSGCSVKLLDQNETPSIANTCHATSDCGTNGSCENGVCVAASSSIDQVLVEVIPDSQSEFGGLSFVSTLDSVQTGARDRAIDLPAAQGFVPQVRANLADFPNCPMDGGKQQLAARLEYTRVSSVGGVPIFGLPKVSFTVDLLPGDPLMPVLLNSQSVKQVPILPGTYDIYVKPAVDPAVLSKNKGCEVGPYMLRGVVVTEYTAADAAHATIDLPKPVVLDGTVVRGKGGTLVGWTLDVVEPQEGRVISTLGPVGATDINFVTNFQTITYLPPSISQPASVGAATNDPSAGSPLVRLTPPPELLASAPTVYWELAAADINGVDANGHEKVSLDMTGVPIADLLVDVSGQVTGSSGVSGQATKTAIPSSLRFFSISLDGALGLTAVFNPSVVTDNQGRYTIKLFPGQYRVVATPNPSDGLTAAPVATDSTTSGVSITNPWAISESQMTIAKASIALGDVALSPKIILHGTALSDPNGAPAMGATFEVVPSILLTNVGVLRSALAQAPALPASASVPIADNKNGAFSLAVDPGDFDLSLRPTDTSNFAWWVLPAKRIDSSSAPVMARLPLPVPIEGAITIAAPTPDDSNHRALLGNASVRAYAKVPSGTGVTKVGDTRTDDAGHYRLGLPASFGTP